MNRTVTKHVVNKQMKSVNYLAAGIDVNHEVTVPGGKPWLSLAVELEDNIAFSQCVVFLSDVQYEIESTKTAAGAPSKPIVPTPVVTDRLKWDVYAKVHFQ